MKATIDASIVAAGRTSPRRSWSPSSAPAMTPAARPPIRAHAEREQNDRRQPGQLRDQAGLPNADAERGKRQILEPGEDRCDVHWIPASSVHAPNSALLRALWTHAPSSCQAMPTRRIPGWIGRRKHAKQSATPSIASDAGCELPCATSRPVRVTTTRLAHPRCRSFRCRRRVCSWTPANRARTAWPEEVGRVLHVRRPVLTLQHDDRRMSACAARRARQPTP